MSDCFGTKSLEKIVQANHDRVNERFLSVNNEVSDIHRTISLSTEKLLSVQKQIDHLQTLENAALTRNKLKATHLFATLGKRIGIIHPDLFMFQFWLQHVRTTRPERLIRKALAAERELTNDRLLLLQQQLDTQTAQIADQAREISNLRQMLDICYNRPTNDAVVTQMTTLDERFKETENNNHKFLAMIDALATNVSRTIDGLATSHTDHVDWVIGNFAAQLKKRIFLFSSAAFSLGGIPGFQMTLEIAGAAETAAPLPGSVSVRISCRTESRAELELVILDKKLKVSHLFDANSPEIRFDDVTTISRAYDHREDCLTVSLYMISLVSKIAVAGGHGKTLADMHVAASSANSVQAIRGIVAREIATLQESLASVAEWKIENARAVCGRHIEVFSTPFKLQGLGQVVLCLSVDKIEETAVIRAVVSQAGLKTLKLAVSVGSQSRVLEASNISGDRVTLERRQFCKVYPEIENITDTLVVVVRVIDLQFYSGSAGLAAIQVKTYRAPRYLERENDEVARPVFVPPLNESSVYAEALAREEKEATRIRQLT